MTEQVTITYLEMTEPGQLVAAGCPEPGLTVAECMVRQPDVNRFLYSWIGRQWEWTDKLVWTERQWAEYACDANLRTWIACVGGSIAGYFELHRQVADVEIRYFGITPEFIGKGYGKYLLCEAIRQGWVWQAERVWVHTCTKDHPAALPNYQARGMRIYKTQRSLKK